MTEVTLEKNGKVAIIKMAEGGKVRVEQDGNITTYRPVVKMEDIIQELTVQEDTNNQTIPDFVPIPDNILKAVDEYIELHEQVSTLKKQMDKLKKEIKPFMETNLIESIQGSNGKEVYLQQAKASNSTSRYTDYELKDLMHVLEGSLLKKVTEIRVNADKLEALLKLEKLPKDKVEKIKSLKIVKMGTPRFNVRRS